MSDAFILTSHLSFAWPDGTLVFDDLSAVVGSGRTGLVAPNGAGKSTLLRLIAGELLPGSGTISVSGSIGYLPQHLPFAGDLTVAQVMGIAPILTALRAIEAGDASEEHFTAVGNDWDIEERTRGELDRLGLGELPFGQRLRTLSGGQVVSLGLASQLLKQPDVLLLDEPTNNLDLLARRRLYNVLDQWNGCLLLASHDRAILDRVERIGELELSRIRLYGGNFHAYEAAVQAEQEVAERNVRSAELAVKREKRDRQQARERASRRATRAARNVESAGLPKVVAGTLKRRAQESAGKSDDVAAARVHAAKARLDDAANELRDNEKLALELPGTRVPAGRTVFFGSGLQASFDGQNRFAGSGIDLAIRGPERVALAGPNGAGKSTLLRILAGELPSAAGTASRADGRVAYLSQRLDLLAEDRTVAENLAQYAPELPEAERLNALARFLFRGYRAHLPVAALSGGERLRATLACVLCAEPPPHLLLLDEPTNNLDLVGVRQLESALHAYRGALVVVSHDERFLADIGIIRWLKLTAGRLQEGRLQDDE